MSDIHGSGEQGHAAVTLSLTFPLDDGGKQFESWDLCECSVAALRARLLREIGAPDCQTRATAAEVAATAQAVLRVPADPGSA